MVLKTRRMHHMHVGKIYARQNHLKAKNSYRTSDVFARGRVLASRVVWWVLLLRKRVWVLLASALATTDNRTGTRHITVRKKDVSYADAKYSAKGHPLPSFQHKPDSKAVGWKFLTSFFLPLRGKALSLSAYTFTRASHFWRRRSSILHTLVQR